MKGQPTRTAVCPLCGKTYSEHPALSRTDGETRICPDCGSRQAMAAMGATPEEQEEIVRIIHAHTGREH